MVRAWNSYCGPSPLWRAFLVATYLLKTSKMTTLLEWITLRWGSTGACQATGRSIRADKEYLHSIMHHHLHFWAILGPRINLAMFMVHLSLNRKYSVPQILGQTRER